MIYFRGVGSSGTSHGGSGSSYSDLYPGSSSTYSSTTGIKVTVNQATGGQIGSETRPKNMNVIYIMRVF